MGEFQQMRVRVPPIEALMKLPNWSSCIDEELEFDDADTLLKPALNQTTIDETVAFTAATVADESHKSVEAAFGAYLTLGHVPEYVVFYVSGDIVVVESDVLTTDRIPLPIKLRSLLPCVDTGRCIEIQISQDGEFLPLLSEVESEACDSAVMAADLRLALK